MRVPQNKSSKVIATVDQVLPLTGLAYCHGDGERTWAVTKSTPGSGLTSLVAGRSVELTVTHYPGFSVVSAYAALD